MRLELVSVRTRPPERSLRYRRLPRPRYRAQSLGPSPRSPSVEAGKDRLSAPQASAPSVPPRLGPVMRPAVASHDAHERGAELDHISTFKTCPGHGYAVYETRCFIVD